MVWHMTQLDAPAIDEKRLSAAAPAVGPCRIHQPPRAAVIDGTERPRGPLS